MNKRLLSFSLSLIFLFSFSTANASSSYGTSPFDKKIIVMGYGKIITDPTYAIYKINFQVTDEDIAIVKLKHQKLQDKIMTAIKNLGIAEKDILVNLKAEVLPSNSGYNSATSGQFSLSKRIFITVHDLNNIEKLTLAITEYKNVHFESLEYRIKNIDELNSQSFTMAIEDARKTAQQLASQTGLVLGKISGVNLTGQHTKAREYNASANTYYNYSSSNSSANEVLTAPGKLFVHTSVSLSFDVSQGNKPQETSKTLKTPTTNAVPASQNTPPSVVTPATPK